MKNTLKLLMAVVICMTVALSIALPVMADNENTATAADNSPAQITKPAEKDEDSATGVKAIAAAVCVGLAAAAGAMGMAMAISKTNDGISRQPEASSSLRTSLMLGLVFIETAIIYALIVAILIIFVL